MSVIVPDRMGMITHHRQCSRRAAIPLSGEGFDTEPHGHWSLTQRPESQPEDLREGQKEKEERRSKSKDMLHQAAIHYC